MSLPVPQRCIACGQPQDYFGEHALCCKAMGVYAIMPSGRRLRTLSLALASRVSLKLPFPAPTWCRLAPNAPARVGVAACGPVAGDLALARALCS